MPDININSIKADGRIIKLIGGLYSVESPVGISEVHARGVFRKKGISPVVGDFVSIDNGFITEIKPRKNIMMRPPVANLDRLFFVISTTEPVPNYYVTDQLIAVCEFQQIEPIIVYTKSDILENPELKEIYSSTGIITIEIDYSDDKTVQKVRDLIKNKVCAFTGNSGAGKSTLLNHASPDLSIETNMISYKLGRGKHTTRHSEFYHICGGLACDTPGFSAFNIADYKKIDKAELAECFREFKPFLGKCRFTNCSHTVEKGCAVIDAVNKNIINKKRHENYCIMYNELKKIKEWEK